VDAVRRAIQQTRLLARGLAPIELQNGDLHAALSELASDTSMMFQINCVFESADGPTRLDGETVSNLYRIAQESVQNAIKHGQASHIRIGLDCQNPQVLLQGRGQRHGTHDHEAPRRDDRGPGECRLAQRRRNGRELHF
jgi:signal transduction histidine kinase